MLIFRELAALVHGTVGLRLREQDADAIRTWISQRAAEYGLAIASYLKQLREGSHQGRFEREQLTLRLTTGETYFNRDQALFALLSRELIPMLIHSRSDQRKLKIWSAGCSTGEEAYTLGMLMDEHATLLAGWDVEIIATDINSEALSIARRGIYRDWSFRSMDNLQRQKYFRPNGRHWEIDEGLRQRVRFQHLDLFSDPVPNLSVGVAGFDLILCRNVFIYMQPDAVSSISSKLSSALVDGGFFVAGHGELLGHNLPGLRTRVYPEAVILQKKNRAEACARHSDLVVAAPKIKSAVHSKELKSPKPLARRMPEKMVHSRADDSQADFQKWMIEAWACANRGQSGIANDLCNLATAEKPLDPWPYYLKAQLAQESGDDSYAREMLDRVIYLDDSHVAAYIELASILDHEGNAIRARRVRRAACRVLSKMDSNERIRPYESSTAAEMLAFIELHLDQPSVVGLTGKVDYRHEIAHRVHGT